MDSNKIEDRIKKLREERLAREKARIEKLKELNLKKYSKSATEAQLPVKTVSSSKIGVGSHSSIPRPSISHSKPAVKSNSVTNNDAKKRCSSVPVRRDIPQEVFPKPKIATNDAKPKPKLATTFENNSKIKNTKSDVKIKHASDVKSSINDKPNTEKDLNSKIPQKPKTVQRLTISRKSMVATDNTSKVNGHDKNIKSTADRVLTNKPRTDTRKSFVFGTTFKAAPAKQNVNKVKSNNTLPTPKSSTKVMKTTASSSRIPTTSGQNVFDRLYKPKSVIKAPVDEVKRLKTDPEYLRKVMKDASLITNRRYTVYEPLKSQAPVRRSISAVHFKKINKDEIHNCIHKWSSIGEKLDKVHLEDINEDNAVKQDRVISAVKSERKKVKFQTPVPYNFNTPKPKELQEKLQKWLQKRGKSLDSFHHLQCFGLHHLTYSIKPLNLDASKPDSDENKENIPLDSDSDDDSYHDIMNDEDSRKCSSIDKKNNDLNLNGSPTDKITNGLDNIDTSLTDKNIIQKDDNIDFTANKWRRASNISDSVDFNESHCTQDITLTSTETPRHVDGLLLGALTDLTQMLREGYEWDQCARWLRAIRERFPSAPDTAEYWECRAALEERRGDLPTSIHCWEEAIAKGTQQSVAEANLDLLLDKFMQLKISPNSGKRQIDPKMVDVKNIFKSTIIRFAVQQAKLRQSTSSPKFICTPVRRSARLSGVPVRTPLQLCSSVKQAAELHDVKFVRNERLVTSP